MGVLFENSIVCHVFYAMVLGAVHDGLVWFVVCGFWGLFCFGLPGLFVVGVGLGLVWFSGLCTGLSVLVGLFGLVGVLFVGFVWRV